MLWLIVLAALLLAAPAHAAPFFLPLGDIPSGSFVSRGLGVSDDHSTAVGSGTASSDITIAARWGTTGHLSELGDLAGGIRNSFANAASQNGSTIVGQSTSGSGPEAFRWTHATGMVGLGDLPGGAFASEAHSVSGDGSVVVGTGTGLVDLEAMRWTSSTGMTSLGLLPGDVFSIASDVSLDGSIVVGYSDDRRPDQQFRIAFRWTADGGMVRLADRPGGVDRSGASAISADGSTIVGSASGPFDGGRDEAVVWRSDGSVIPLGDLPGGSFGSAARGVSGDGSIVVGSSEVAGFMSDAFIWDETHGMRSIRQLATERGIDLTGWQLGDAWDISADGRAIVGTGRNPSGNTEAWLLVIPETGTALLLGAGLLGLAARARNARA